MKFEVGIRAVMNEKDPAYTTIAAIGIEKAIEKFKKELAQATGIESLDISIKELKDENSKG
jgi:hypothetical protein